MKSISIWGKQHVWATRVLIVLVIYPLLNLTAFWLGDMLLMNEVHISFAWIYLLAPLCFFLAATYPSKRNKQKNFYFRQKATDGLLALSTFCFIALIGNNFNTTANENAASNSIHAAIQPAPGASHIKKGKKKGVMRMLQRLEKKYRDAGKGTKVLLVILTLLAAVLLIYLLAALSCSVACGGAEALAYILFLVGLGGIIFGAARIIHRIVKGPREKKSQKVS